MSLKVIALIVMTALYLYRLCLDCLERRSVSNPIPAGVADIYDAETYKKWRAYHSEKTFLGICTSSVSFLVSFTLMLLDVYAAFARLFPEPFFWQMFAVLLLSALSDLVLLPFEYHDTMVIEEKYGFNRSSKKTFWTDQVKNLVLELFLMTLIGSALMGTHLWLGDWLIVGFALIMMAFALIMSFLYPFFSKIFNKFKPLEDGELKEKVTALLEKHGYRVRAIQVMDASRRTSKSNAYFTGFGKMKTIVLYDTLVEAMTPDEICAVFAHEMGHGLHRDTLKNQALSFIQMAILAVLAWLTLRSEVFTPFGFPLIERAGGPSAVNYGFAILLIMSVEFALVNPLWGLVSSWFSRRAEYRADAQAVEEGYGDALVSALKKLARENFSNLAPDPIVVRLTYSHPTLSQRIDAIEARTGARRNPD
ncbi:MAG: M48 family metallopeptidase [Clostridia bacterium]|nr:M48 family metallopeptidase [Clostridia bacterium]